MAAQDLQFRHQTVAVEGGHRHFGAVAAVGAHPRDAVLQQSVLPHLRHQPHAFDDVATRATEVDGLAARVDVRRDLDDDHAVAGLAEPESEKGSGAACAADQHGRLCHGNQSRARRSRCRLRARSAEPSDMSAGRISVARLAVWPVTCSPLPPPQHRPTYPAGSE